VAAGEDARVQVELEIQVIPCLDPVNDVVAAQVVLIPQLQVDIDEVVAGVYGRLKDSVGPEVCPVGAAVTQIAFAVEQALMVDLGLRIVVVRARLAEALVAVQFDHPVQMDSDVYGLGIGRSGA
jgi:hypothetical protein